ncbi:MAG: immunoglobulin domain-containing protein [Verrucomicrobiota bacterium]|nr:immunoglobulin domain-containing protein [Verrucomicrobiota bacterium]
MLIQLKLARAQMGLFILLALLQRTPIIKYAFQFEKASAASVAKLIKATTYVATGMGLFHATAGATTYVINPASPANATVGEEFALAFDIIGTPSDASSWRVTGQIPPGLTVPGLAGDNINTEDPVTIVGTPSFEGTYNITVKPLYGANQTRQTTTATTITIIVAEAPPDPPVILRPPASTRAPTGGRAQFFFEPEGVVDSIQWFKDGTEIPGATAATLVLRDVSAADEGAYSVEVANVSGSAVSAAGSLTIDNEGSADLVNLATRGFVGTGADIMIGGLTVLGGATKTVLVRGLGPQLTADGVPGALADPELSVFQTLFDESPIRSQLLVTNDNWEEGPNAAELAAALTAKNKPLVAGSKDAALLLTLNQGVYTFQLSGVAETEGVGLIELFVVAETSP